MRFADRVTVVEVGPRDGLQNEAKPVSTEAKVRLIENLADAGLKTIECGSFVSAKWVPQMADTAAVFQQLRKLPGVSYVALVPNRKGLEAAMACGVEEIAVFASASETFSERNVHSSIAESMMRFGEVTEEALRSGMKVRGYVSCVLGCPYEGEIALEAVVRVASALAALGCCEISLGDTIGVGTPLKTQRMLEAVGGEIPMNRLAVHFHDTWGQGLANILAALDMGVAVVDAAVAGLGGCPYAPGATGNVATEDVVYMLNGMGVETGIDLARLGEAGREIATELGRRPASRAGAALRAQLENAKQTCGEERVELG